MAATDRDSIVGVFSDRSKAQEAVRAEERGVHRKSDRRALPRRGPRRAGPRPGDELDGGRGHGHRRGDRRGRRRPAALGIAAGMLPVIGPAVAGGLLMSVVASAGGAATAGTIVGGLVGLGVPQSDADYYEGEFKSGRSLITVQAGARNGEALRILQQYGASSRSSASSYASV